MGGLTRLATAAFFAFLAQLLCAFWRALRKYTSWQIRSLQSHVKQHVRLHLG
jgi:hypothetical protein